LIADQDNAQSHASSVWALHIPQAFIVLLALIPLVVFLRVAFSRLFYPFDLEWIEGHMLAMAVRVARGLSLYPEPSLDYIPAPYFPGYFLLTGGLVKIFGSQFWVGRFLSILAALGTGLLVFHAVRKRTGDYLIGLACMAIFFASYGFTSSFYDLFRVDSLAIFTLILAFVVADPKKGYFAAALTGLALFAAVMVKQNALLFYPGLACVFFVKDWRKGLVFSIVFAVLTAGVCGAWHIAGGGWFLKYTFALVTNDPIQKRYYLVHVWLLTQYALPIAIVGLSIVSRLSSRRFQEFFGDKWLAFFAISYVVSYLFRITSGGARNAMIPVSAGCAVAAGAMLPEALAFIRGRMDSHSALPIKKPAALWALSILLVVQLLAQGHWFDKEILTTQDKQAARKFLNMVDGLDGTYYMPGHVLPRDNTYWIHEMSWRDFGKAKWAKPYAEQLAESIRSEKFDYLIIEGKTGLNKYLRKIKNRDYKLYKNVPTSMKLRMLSATKTAPQKIYKRKSP
jgi:hypothetical protein